MAAGRMAAAASAAAKAVGAGIPRFPPIFDPLDAAAASLAPEDLQREREVGVALGLKSMLATTLESWRARHRPGSGASCGP